MGGVLQGAGERARLAIEDPAIEVRARAAGQLSPNTEADRDGSRVSETARSAAALRAMAGGGVLAPDMVRALAGTLVEIGRGRRDDKWIAEVIAARDRSVAGQTAPPHGLTLLWVAY